MTLPASEIERIRIDAQKAFPITDTSTFSGLMQDFYISGAQAEAVRGREMAIAFMEWTSDRGWLLHPDCDEDEERMWYKPSDDFNIPDERMFGGQLYDLYILDTQKRKG